MGFSFVRAIPTMPPMDRVKAYIVLGFSILVGLAFLVSLGMLVYLKVKTPGADISLFVNVFLTCLGYIVGILTGLLGIPQPTRTPGPGPATPGPNPS